MEDKELVFTVNDSSSSALIDGDPFIASAVLRLKEVLATPGEFVLRMKSKAGALMCLVVVKAQFEPSESYTESVAQVG